MKIYVDEKTQEVRIDFGLENYALAYANYEGKVRVNTPMTALIGNFTENLVYETPAPPLEWPTKPNALVVAGALYRRDETYVREDDYWVNLHGVAKAEEDLELKRIIFEGEDTQ